MKAPDQSQAEQWEMKGVIVIGKDRTPVPMQWPKGHESHPKRYGYYRPILSDWKAREVRW